jgi:hypothetical protein
VVTSLRGTPLGWIDATHLVVSSGRPDSGTAVVLDVRTGAVHSSGVAAAALTMFGVLPAAL